MSHRAHVWLRALAVAFAVLALALALTWRESPAPPDGRAESHTTVFAPHPGVASLPGLFAAAPAGPSEIMPAGDLPELVGVIGRLPDDAEVLVRTQEGGSITLRVGQAIAGWTLVAVSIDRAVFDNGRDRRVLTISPAG